MQNISTVTPIHHAAGQKENDTQAATTGGENDFQTFLTLLTAQMRNQDPLKPMDSTEFVAQLASFSSVEQQIETNEKLTHLISLMSGGSTSGLAEWIGKEVRHPGAENYDGTPIEVGVAAGAAADDAFLIVKDAAGQIVYRQQFDPSDDNIIWSGELTDGGTAQNGAYSFGVENFKDGNLIGTSGATQFGLVTEARAEPDGIHLVFADGSSILADDATSVRLPE